MGSRWFNSVVVLFWLSTMTWLVVAKVVPPMRRGDPPNYQSMYAGDSGDKSDEQPVGWEMTLNGKPLGWAVNKLARMGTGVTEVRGRIHFDRIPLQEFSPTWTQVLLQTIATPAEGTQMDVFSALEIDPLGHLTRFRSALRVAGMRDSVIITGRAQASRLIINVESGSFQSPTYEAYLPRDALVADELSPQTRITGLQLNQEWTVPVFSPLRPPKNPVEILQAKVEGRQPVEWEGKVAGAFEVVYRSDSGSVLYSSREPRARLWVRDDGTVLKQEVNVLGSRLVFTRMNTQKSVEISQQAERDDDLHRERRKARYMQLHGENADNPGGGRPPWMNDEFRNRERYWRQRRGDYFFDSRTPPPRNNDAPQPAPPAAEESTADEQEKSSADEKEDATPDAKEGAAEAQEDSPKPQAD